MKASTFTSLFPLLCWIMLSGTFCRQPACADETPTTAAPVTNALIAPFTEHFAGPTLNTANWVLTRKNDFHESTIDVVGTTADQSPAASAR